MPRDLILQLAHEAALTAGLKAAWRAAPIGTRILWAPYVGLLLTRGHFARRRALRQLRQELEATARRPQGIRRV